MLFIIRNNLGELMETVLYELNYTFPTLVIVLLVFALVLFIFVWLAYITGRKNGYSDFRLFWINKPTTAQIKKFMKWYWVVLAVICLIFFFVHWNWYDSLRDKYEAGNCEEVCGYVEDFKTGAIYGSGKKDVFTVEGVEFIVNPADMLYGDYIKIRDKGGVITGDGQHLHINYINRYVGNVVERYIVYIAEIEE